MFTIYGLIVIINIGLISTEYSDECERNIFERCNHQAEFTDQELNDARVWLQNFMLQTPLKPTKAPCSQIFVRKDFKCMTDGERIEFIRVIRLLYESGVMSRLADIHSRYWAEVHKTAQLGPWHRYFVNELEKQMQQLSPGITIPYYNAQLDASRPEKSMVWRYLGRHGFHSNAYCVTDGPLYEKLNATQCVRRQWTPDGAIPPIDGLELNTMWLQLSKDFVLGNFYESGLHFNTHLAFGGYRGHMSVDTAPFDIQFYLWHNYQMNVMWMKKQLQNPKYATPLDWGTVPSIDQATGQVYFGGDLRTEQLIYYSTPVLDVHHVGFGDLCSIPDQIIAAILQKIRNETVVPLAVRRMPYALKLQFFPHFLSKHFDAFSHSFEEVGDCNPRCRLIPSFQPMVSTENGRRQLKRFSYDENLNIAFVLVLSQSFFSMALTEMNTLRYCSPYIP